MHNRWWKGTVFLAVLAIFAIACGGAEEAAETTQAAAESSSQLATPPDEPKGGVIRIGATPSYDDRLWSYAASIGMDARIGLDLEIIPFVSIPYTQLQTDEIDMLFSCQICYGTIIEEFPEYRNYLITNQYQGFVLIGRAGETVAYEEALERLGNEEAAKAELAESMRGKEFVKTEGFPTTYERGLLENIGLDLRPRGSTGHHLQVLPEHGGDELLLPEW